MIRMMVKRKEIIDGHGPWELGPIKANFCGPLRLKNTMHSALIFRVTLPLNLTIANPFHFHYFLPHHMTHSLYPHLTFRKTSSSATGYSNVIAKCLTLKQ